MCVYTIFCVVVFVLEQRFAGQYIEQMNAGWSTFSILSVTQEEDVDFEVVLSKLVNGMGCGLVTSWNK